MPVAHACNTIYSGSRDQEENSSKSAQANSSQDPILKNSCGVPQGEGPEFKPQYQKKKKNPTI
jgi:ribosome assembly protein YihI (activator of Der GTPase)